MAVVEVGGVYPPGSTVSITGQVVSGDGHVVGGIEGHQLGTVTPLVQTSTVVGGVASAQAFGTVTRITGGVSSSASGVSSAQAFGAITTRSVITLTVTGVSSAQAFGAVAVAQIVHPAGRGSAQSFGAIVTRTGFTQAVGGVSTAQQFGIARAFSAQVVQVPGVAYYDCESIVGEVICGDGHVVGGYPWCVHFGRPWIIFSQFWKVLGVPSAQQFGTPTGKGGPTSRQVQGIGSAQQFGTPDVFLVWDRPLPPCIDEDLDPLDCIDVSLVAITATSLTLTPSVCTDDDLVPATTTEIDLQPLVPT